MASISRDIFAENKPASRGFISLLSFITFQPRRFFRVLDRTAVKHSIMVAALILVLVSFNAIQQSNQSMSAEIPLIGEESLPDDEMLGEVSVAAPSDPSESWMTGLSAVGKQAIYWLALSLVLSEVSLFKGRAPKMGRNLQIAVWSSFPFALMAGLQILFVMGGGTIDEPGFTGFLNEWQGYAALNPYLQSAVYALAAQFNFFSLWSFVLLYKGARETLRGNRIVVGFVLISWLLILTLAFGFEHYQNGATVSEMTEFSYEESLPYEEMPMEEPFYPEDEMNGEEFP